MRSPLSYKRIVVKGMETETTKAGGNLAAGGWNPKEDSGHSEQGLGTGAIVGVALGVVGVLVVMALLVLVLVRRRRRKRRSVELLAVQAETLAPPPPLVDSRVIDPPPPLTREQSKETSSGPLPTDKTGTGRSSTESIVSASPNSWKEEPLKDPNLVAALQRLFTPRPSPFIVVPIHGHH